MQFTMHYCQHNFHYVNIICYFASTFLLLYQSNSCYVTSMQLHYIMSHNLCFLMQFFHFINTISFMSMSFTLQYINTIYAVVIRLPKLTAVVS